MLAIGTVQEIDAARMMARVKFNERGGLLSWWLPVGVDFAHDNRAYRMPDIGDQVACLMDERWEAGVIAWSLYGGPKTPPEQSPDVHACHYSDGTIVRYNRATHTLDILAQGAIHITATQPVMIQAPSVAITGNLSVSGNITATGSIMDTAGNSNHHTH